MRLLVAALGLLLIGAADAPPTDPAFLERIAAASGEPWRFHIVSRASASENHRLVQIRTDAEGERVLSRRCLGSVCSGSYVDGAYNALFSYNDVPIAQSRPTSPRTIALRALSSYAFVSPSFRAAGGRVAFLGSRRLGETAMRVVEVTTAGTTLQALIDPVSMLLIGVADDTGKTLLTYEDQRRVGPVTLPFAIRGEDGTRDTIDERAIDPSPLRAPEGPVTTYAAAPTAMSLAGGSAIPRFPCRIESVDVTCMLDTGASGLAMSLDLADRLQKTPIGQIELEGLGYMTTGVVRAQQLELGGLTVGSALYAILPDTTAFKADVILGADVLARSVVRLDLRRRTVAFAPLGTQLEGTVIPLGFDRFLPFVAVQLGDLPARLSIDTGDEASIDLPIAVYRAHPELFVARGMRQVAGVGGRGTQIVGEIARVRLGEFTFTRVPIGATDVGFSTRPRLGADFLVRLSVEFDYANARLALRSPP